MAKRYRWTSRRKTEVETSVTTIPTDVMSEDSRAIHTRLKRDETEGLARVRRQGARAASAPPPAAPPPAPEPPKRRSWLRFFGLGEKP